MANPVIRISPVNSIRLIPQTVLLNQYNSLPMDLREGDDCYFMKWETVDTPPMQISALNAVNDLTLKLYAKDTFSLIKTFVLAPITLTVLNDPDYKYYETTLNFSDVDPGNYYLELTCTNPNDGSQIVLQSDVWNIDTDQPNTVRLDYKNSENDFSIIFDTGIVFQLRVEGTIEDYDPSFQDTNYTDERFNQTRLNSTFYDKFTFYSPAQGGYIVPWIAKKVNIAMSMDNFKIDGYNYNRLDGSKFDVTRSPNSRKMGIKIDILPTDNLFQRLIKTGNANPGNFVIVQKKLDFLNQAADFNISGIFKKYTDLEKVCIINNNNTAFTLKIGTQPNTADIATIYSQDENADVITDTLTEIIESYFNGATTVYFSGLTGTAGLSLDITVVFKQLDAPAINLPFTVPDTLGKGATMRYEEITPGDLVGAFDLSTGLGIVGSKWAKWAMKDGRNGGVDESGCIAVMYDPSNPDYSTLKLKSGSASGKITLTTDQLPNFFLHMFGPDPNTGTNVPGPNNRVARYRGHASQPIDYEMVQAINDANDNGMIGRTSSIGNGASIDTRQKYIVGLTIIKIQD